MTCKSRKHIFRCCRPIPTWNVFGHIYLNRWNLRNYIKAWKLIFFSMFEFHHFILFRTWLRKEQYLEKSVGKSHALISLSLFSYSSTIIFLKKLTLGHLTIKIYFFSWFSVSKFCVPDLTEKSFWQIKKTSSVFIGAIFFAGSLINYLS